MEQSARAAAHLLYSLAGISFVFLIHRTPFKNHINLNISGSQRKMEDKKRSLLATCGGSSGSNNIMAAI